MKYLLSISLVIILGAFNGIEQRQSQANSIDCFKSAVPKFMSTWYTASIDVVGHHISGLILFKTMPDSSQRLVFTNEAGLTFFDFEWNQSGGFKVHHVIRKLKKRIVLNALRKDFELIVVPASLRNSAEPANKPGEFVGTRKKEKLKFRTDSDCKSLTAIEVMGTDKKLIDCVFFPAGKNIPDSISIVHYNFNMRIDLKKIERNVVE